MRINLKSAICKNGHLQSSILQEDEKYRYSHCRECGEKIIDSCINCHSLIIGGYAELSEQLLGHDPVSGYPIFSEDEDLVVSDDKVPKYCHECGKPYPWIEKKLNDFKEILELQNEEITLDLQSKIFDTVKELTSEINPESSLGIAKLGLLIKKLPSKEIFISTLSGLLSSGAIELLNKAIM